MTGIKIWSLCAMAASVDAAEPMMGIPFEKFGAYGLAAFCVWQMWLMIQRREKALADKDAQVNRMLTIMEQKPCLHGQVSSTLAEAESK